jgi:hypothetical protein
VAFFRVIKGQAILEARRPLFVVPSDADLPPLPGNAPGHNRDLLAVLLEELVAAAGCNRIPAPCLAPDAPSIIDAFAALENASVRFEVAQGLSLAGYLWAHAAALRDGTMSAKLQATVNGAAAQGFLALYSSEVSAPLIYSPAMSPLRVRDGLGTDCSADGPFLALVVCEASPAGHAEAIQGYAIPIYHARRFFPVGSNLDRDVLRALEHLQVTLDAYGTECSIQRDRPFTGGGPTRLTLSITTAQGRPRLVHLAIDPAGNILSSNEHAAHVSFVVTNESWKDGRFVAWLEDAVGE